ncbi:ras-related protein Rab-18A isoform X2 [Parasteatoda tepidariorum]|uniref:ras-related protein Rab-18A isoform X2 n=1 Tax=Parasteatoda tepidariorum TaxID=114398 RepID=UPI001C71F764|nr:ras-related protein Rab-18A isoform X2 [Parasteatoda tepidariorum]
MSVINWNIILVGESGVGKTSIVQRYVHEKFAARVSATIAVDHAFKDVEVEGTKIRLVIWDSAGQEIYKSIVPQYFRKADGCILVYDVTNMTTFHKLSGWLSEFRSFNEEAPVVLAGNKNEDPNRKSVSVSVVKSYAQQEDMEYMECSAKTGENVERVFKLLIEKMWNLQMGPVSTGVAPTHEYNSISRTKESNDFSIISQKSEIPYKNCEDQPISLTDIPPLAVEKKKKKCC